LFLLLTQSALSAIDTSPHSLLLSQISQKEAALDAARASNDIGAIISITRELDSLRDQLASPQMRFLRRYSSLGVAMDESGYLIQQIEANLGPDAAAQLKADMALMARTLSSAETAYESQDYEAADSLMDGVYDQLIALPATLSSASIGGVEVLKDQMERTSQVTPSMLSMLDNSKEKFKTARDLYARFSQKTLSSDADEASALLGQAHKAASEAFALVARAKEQEGDLLEPIKLALILGPLALIIGLLVYFRFQFSKSAIGCSLSSATAPGGKESKIERTIGVTNIEKVPISVRVFDSPPKALSPSGYNLKPVNISGNDLTWEFDLDPGKKVLITYNLTVPRLDSGWKLRANAATASYEIDGKQKRSVGKSAEIRIT